MYQPKEGDPVRSLCVTLGDITGTVLKVIDDNTIEVAINDRPTLQLTQNWELIQERRRKTDQPYHVPAPGSSAEAAVQWAAQALPGKARIEPKLDTRHKTAAPAREQEEPLVSFNASRAPKQRMFTLEQHEVKYVANQLLMLGVAFEVGTRHEGLTVLMVDPSRDMLAQELIKLVGGK